MNLDGENGCRKILAALCLYIHDCALSEIIKVETIRLKVLRVMLENENGEVVGSILSKLCGDNAHKHGEEGDIIENNAFSR